MVDVDDVRQMVVAGHAAPWAGEEGRRQHRLGVENACALARRWWVAGVEVVIADIVLADTIDLYRQLVPEVMIIRLILPFDEARKRASLRAWHLTEKEFADLVRVESSADLSVDGTVEIGGLDLAQQTQAVADVWMGGWRTDDGLTAPR